MKKPVIITAFMRYCSGVKRHAWYQSSVGIIRKPVGQTIQELFRQAPKMVESKKEIVKYTLWQRIKLLLKRIFKL